MNRSDSEHTAFLEAARMSSERLGREHARRRISDPALRTGSKRLAALLDACDKEEADFAAFSEAVERVLSDALREPRQHRLLEPLPTDQVATADGIVLLRRVIGGEATMTMIAPPLAWEDVRHTTGDVLVESWTLALHRRDDGIRYVDQAVAPDGRRSTYEQIRTAREIPSRCSRTTSRTRHDQSRRRAQPAHSDRARSLRYCRARPDA